MFDRKYDALEAEIEMKYELECSKRQNKIDLRNQKIEKREKLEELKMEKANAKRKSKEIY